MGLPAPCASHRRSRKTVVRRADQNRNPRQTRSGKLVRVLPKVRLPERGLYVVYLERRNALPKLRAFIDFMIASFGPEPEWDRGLSQT
jgi:DNA-binding transcriptional LysR family regulator